MKKVFNNKKLKLLRSRLRYNATRPENKLWQEINNNQLGYKFRRQVSINNFVVDFYCPKLKLVIELDGHSHNNDDSYFYDDKRDLMLRSLGLEVVHYSNQEVFKDLENIVEDIKSVCDNISAKEK